MSSLDKPRLPTVSHVEKEFLIQTVIGRPKGLMDGYDRYSDLRAYVEKQGGTFIKDSLSNIQQDIGINASEYIDEPIASPAFKNCVCVILSGRNKKTGNRVACMMHHYSLGYINWKASKEASEDFLLSTLENFAYEVELGTVDGIIAGGNYFSSPTPDGTSMKDDYEKTIQYLTARITQVFPDMRPRVTAPDRVGGGTDVYFDTPKGVAYIMTHTPDGQSHVSYDPSALPDLRKKWEAK